MNIRSFRINQNNLFYIAGIFSTMTAVSLFGVTIFYWILLSIVALQLFLKPRIIKNRLMIAFIMVMFFSCFLSLCHRPMADYWISANIKKTCVFFITFGLICLIYCEDEKEKITNSFLRGLYVSVWLQLIWGLLQFILWYSFHIELNQVVFSDILHMQLENSTWSFIYESGSMRLTGISWEPAYFSIAMVSGFLLSKNIIFKLMFALTCLLSTSRTGIVILTVAVLLDVGIFDFSTKINNSKIKRIFELLAIGLIASILVFCFSEKARSIVSEAWTSLILWNSTTSGGTHFNYIKYIPHIITNISFLQLLFGFGIGSSGYPYSLFYDIEFAAYHTAWSVESDYINILWALGIIGLIIYMIMLIRAIKYARRKEIQHILICMFVGGVFYIYYGTWLFLLVALQLSQSKGNPHVNENHNGMRKL